ncbi:MAG: thioredoxin domain-containing protein [Nitrospira sp.]|nr:thioredoxin domain-containing protein [Nitrospira sp.]
MDDKHTNRLIHEISPYLLQHAHNPVEWYPWGEEAFNKAKSEDKPVLLSIGYSACHWCHVMEKESFENEEIAAIMNQYFINIKVDREERPDIDELFQYSMQLLGAGNGGWPLTVFLTPEGNPFYGGTYFPPEERQGMQGLPDVLHAVAGAYRDRRRDIESTTIEIRETLARISNRSSTEENINISEIDNASSKILRIADLTHGGFGTAPKFPNTTQLSLLLRHHKRTGDALSLDAVKKTLRNMAEGGIYDQLGGGFHRYSVDERWLIPHFEKMLYDNALLSVLYLSAYKVTSDPGYKTIAEDTLHYLLREMYHTGGGFYSSQDADSEGEEGKFFVWSKEEIRSITGNDAEIICRFYGVTEDGNFEGKNILHIDRGLKALSHEFEIPEDKIRGILNRGREALFTYRNGRVKPFQDTKILTGWNGLAVSAFIEAYSTTGKDLYLDTARTTLDFIKSELYREDKLLHEWKEGVSKGTGDINDYAFMIAAIIDMFEVSFDETYLNWAASLAGSMIAMFWDKEQGGFYSSTGDDNVKLFHRMKTANDAPIPSGNAVALSCLLRLFYYKDKKEYRTMSEQLVRLFYEGAIENPFNFSSLLSGIYLFLEGARELTICGRNNADDIKNLLKRLGEQYIPDKVIYLIGGLTDETKKESDLPEFARGKTSMEGKATAYICRNFTCSRPLTEWEDIIKLL